MKQLLAAVCGVFIAVAPAFAQTAHPEKSKKTSFHLSQTLAVGDETLKPGDYKFQCKKIDGQDFLVVTSEETGREVARVPCRPEMLDHKTDISEFRSAPRPDGTRALTAVMIKGETIAHRVIVN